MDNCGLWMKMSSHFSFVSKKKCLVVSRQETINFDVKMQFPSKYLEFSFVISQKFSSFNSRGNIKCDGVETLFARLFGWYTECWRVKARNKMKSSDLRFKTNLFIRVLFWLLILTVDQSSAYTMYQLRYKTRLTAFRKL